MISGWGLATGLAPVLLFLLVLRLMDSYKLVRRRDIARSIGAGAVAAIVAYVLNRALVEQAGLEPTLLRRYVAPVLEELLKAALVVYVIRTRRVGFLVDAAIHGFAIGTGFALAENLYYALTLEQQGVGLWLARGFGTAILHGSTTALVAILAQELTERRRSTALVWFVPGLVFAIALHSLYNHVLFNPLLAAALVILMAPPAVVLVFEHSERATRDWLGTGLDSDMERIEQLTDGPIADSPIGKYMGTIRHRFSGAALADMLCLLRIHLELSMRAKGTLIARAAGVDLPPDETVVANLRELRYLERSIGPTGRLAIQPLLQTSGRELWQVTMLEVASGAAARR